MGEKVTRIEVAIANMQSTINTINLKMSNLDSQKSVMMEQLWMLEKLRDDKNFDDEK